MVIAWPLEVVTGEINQVRVHAHVKFLSLSACQLSGTA